MSRRGPLAAFLAFGVLWGGWAALLPAVQAGTGASEGQLGLALLFVAAGALPAMLLAGRALDRRGPRVLPWFLAALAGAALLPGLAGSVPVLAACLLALGVAAGATDVAMNGAVAELEARRDTRLMQLAHAVYSGGVLFGALGVGVARELGAGRLLILAGLAASLAAAAALNAGHDRLAARPGRRAPLRLNRAAIPLGVVCGLAFVIEGGMENWGAIFLERNLEASPGAGSLAPAAYGGAMMLGRLSAHRLERRLGDTQLLAGALVVALVGLAAAAAAQTVPWAVAAFFVGGAGISIAAPALFGAGGRNAAPDERGAAVATVTTLGYLGFLVGPPLVGGLAEALGLRVAFLALALVAAAIVAATPRLGLADAQAAS